MGKPFPCPDMRSSFREFGGIDGWTLNKLSRLDKLITHIRNGAKGINLLNGYQERRSCQRQLWICMGSPSSATMIPYIYESYTRYLGRKFYHNVYVLFIM